MQQPKHLSNSEGSLCPPLIAESLRIYNMKYCPYAERALLSLVHKNVKFDIVNIHLKDKPDWYIKMSRPSGAKVPLLQRADGQTLGESLVTMQYIDETYPGPELLTKDPWQKAQNRVTIEDFSAVISALYKFYNPILTDKEKGEILEKVKPGYATLEKDLISRGSKFFNGGQPGFVDFAIWPWFERLPVFKDVASVELINKENHPTLICWIESMKAHPTVQKVMVPEPEMLEFMRGIVSGNYVFDR